MRKILFLDVDGVLNNLQVLSTKEELGRDHLLLLKSIVNVTNCEVVLSSSWRILEEWKNTLKHAFTEHNIPFWISETPQLKGENFCIVPRKNEILLWLTENVTENTKVVILDDESDADISGHTLSHINDKFIHTCMNHGLTSSHTKMAIEWLNANQP